MTQTQKELNEELKKLESESKRMDIEDKVKAKRLELLKRRYSGIRAIIRLFKK